MAQLMPTQTSGIPPYGPPGPPPLDYARRAGLWAPPPGVAEHGGRPIPADAEFFVPPPQIGAVQSAATTLTLATGPWSMGARLGLGFGVSAGVTAVLVGVVAANRSYGLGPDDAVLFGVLFGVVSLVVVGCTLLATRFQHACTYVGELGAARFKLAGGRGRQPAGEVFLFPDAVELRTRQTRHYYNGVYTGTTYDLTWTDLNGRPRFRLSGRHKGGNGMPKPTDPYHFAWKTEIAWSVYLLDQVQAQLEQCGFVHFNIRPGQWVRVGPGFFDFCLNGEVQRIHAGEIKSINLSQGHFHIAHKDARWFSSRGKFHFDYANMANARLFLLAVDKLVGYKF